MKDKDPILAKIIQREVLNKKGSQKCTMHLTLDIGDHNIAHSPGDSVAIMPQNDPSLVDCTLKALRLKGSEIVHHKKEGIDLSFMEFLLKKANLARISKKWMTYMAEQTTSSSEKSELQALIDNREAFKEVCASCYVWDFCVKYPHVTYQAQDVADMLGPLLPRFYSIASSPKVAPNKIDLLIAYFRYTSNSQERRGVGSHYLCDVAPMNEAILPLSLYPSKDFKLPEDHSTPIIMVGPGTGLAPYRAFMQERLHHDAPGKNWLFFGEWNRDYDFFYEDFWKRAEEQDKLKLSLAFSRDQEDKVYVQHSMEKSSKEIWSWLQEGAIFYVCGDALNMAKDVDKTLHKIVQQEGQMSEDNAKAYIKKLREKNRYLRDVY